MNEPRGSHVFRFAYSVHRLIRHASLTHTLPYAEYEILSMRHYPHSVIDSVPISLKQFQGRQMPRTDNK